jgi:hypothetical protein
MYYEITHRLSGPVLNIAPLDMSTHALKDSKKAGSGCI